MDADDHNALLLFRVGPVCCCAPSRPVTAVVTSPSLHRPPGSDALHPGVFRHVSGLVRVLDLRVGFGVRTAAHKRERIIITRLAEGLCGFLVDEILDVLTWPEHGWGNLPPLLPRRLFRGTLEHDGRLYLYTEFTRLATIAAPGILHGYLQSLQKAVDQAADAPATGKPEPPAAAKAEPVPASDTLQQKPPSPPPRNRSAPAKAASSRSGPAPASAGHTSHTTAKPQRATPVSSGNTPLRTSKRERHTPHRPASQRPSTPPPVTPRPHTNRTNPLHTQDKGISKRSQSTTPTRSIPTERMPRDGTGLLITVVLILVVSIGSWWGTAAWLETETPTVASSLPSGTAFSPPPETPDRVSAIPVPPIPVAAPADEQEAPALPVGETLPPSSSTYRAEIQRDREGITLVLHQSAPAIPPPEDAPHCQPSRRRPPPCRKPPWRIRRQPNTFGISPSR